MTRLLAICLCWLAMVGVSDAATSPNFVIFYMDDLGWADTSVRMMDDEPLSKNDDYETPVLEQLARQGMRFTSHYAGFTVCSPSRCALMTGKHMGHASVTGNGGRLRREDVTVAMLLPGSKKVRNSNRSLITPIHG